MSRGYCPYIAFWYSGDYCTDLTEPCGIFWESVVSINTNWLRNPSSHLEVETPDLQVRYSCKNADNISKNIKIALEKETISTGGGVASRTSPHPQGCQAATAHAHWVRF